MFMIFINILSVFSITLIGFVANKIKWLPLESSKYLSQILVNISSPCLVIYSMSQQDLTSDSLASVKQVMLLMLLMLVAGSILSVPIVKIMKVEKNDQGVYRTLLALTNNGFMGYPLALAVFGQAGLFLMIVANAIFCIYLYSVGLLLMLYDREEKMNAKDTLKSIFSIPVISCVIGLLIFIFGIEFSPVLENFLNTVGSMTIPLSMLIIGIQLAGSSIREVLQNRKLFLATILKLTVMPGILFLIFMSFHFIPLVFCVVVFAMAMPSAAVIVVLADIHGANSRLAAEGVFLTTLFSLISIPFIAILLTMYLAG
ncbi:AEC family transporter [Sinanaerobacter chloroacetimidivorans]|jgi:predicted permease|uniref:AEC family transporter n=1 Tax=Sinanaerobacter chloroacetimidivorans TaxID=2818044 RepID=A0A8J8B2T1_9FIRM|nr:AEC family transporter [Sinanaerobacter chloroacetimidivorans]MBR0597565.1 AEC family transporter [Sinanaerobacter chloroacetimidivorans]